MDTTRRTLARAVEAAGIALHSGATVRMHLAPAPAGTGIVFSRLDLGGAEIPARFDLVSDARLGTTLSAGSARVGVIEHLMAAIAGVGITDLRIGLDGAEPPILDGSAQGYLALIDRAGLAALTGAAPRFEIRKPVTVSRGDASASLVPGEGFSAEFVLEYPEPAIGRQTRTFAFDPEAFRRDIAPARTFGFVRELEALHAAGLGRGASLDNTVALTETGVVNPGGLRFADEFVRHKILDAVGDLALAGALPVGHFVGIRSGHALNNLLLRAVFADPGNCLVSQP